MLLTRKAILSVSQSSAAGTSTLLPKQKEFQVTLATNFLEIRQACGATRFDCVVIGEDIEPKTKRAIAQLIEQILPQTPILEVFRVSPEIDGVASVQSSIPETVLDALHDLLQPNGQRYTEQLARRARLVRDKAMHLVAESKQRRQTKFEVWPVLSKKKNPG